jgi:hypothetical protein
MARALSSLPVFPSAVRIAVLPSALVALALVTAGAPPAARAGAPAGRRPAAARGPFGPASGTVEDAAHAGIVCCPTWDAGWSGGAADPGVPLASAAGLQAGWLARVREFIRHDWEQTRDDLRSIASRLGWHATPEDEDCSLAAWRGAQVELRRAANRIALDAGDDPTAGAPGARPRYLVLIVVDGGQAAKFRSLLARGMLPNIGKHLVTRGLSCFNTVTIWPSTSVPAHVSLMTGRFPRAHGIVFPKWLERGSRHYRDYIGAHVTKIGQDMRPGTLTLFERLRGLRSVSALQVCHRGATTFLPGPPRDGFCARAAIAAQHLFLWSGRIAAAFLRLTRLDREARAVNSLPRVLVLTMPEVDHHTHLVDLDSATADRVHQEVDRHVGSIARALEELGIYDDTVLALTSDHGMGPVHTHLPIHRMLSELGLRVLEPRRMIALGLIGGVFDRIPGIRPDDHDALAMWGGNSEVAIHLKGPAARGAGAGRTGPDGRSWDRRPDIDDLRAYPVPGGGERRSVDLVASLLARPGIGLVIARAGGAVLVHGKGGTSRIEAGGEGAGRRYAYRVVSGRDPLGFAQDPAVSRLAAGEPATAEDWLARTAAHDYPDVPVRLANAFGDTRDADLYVIAERGYDFVPPELVGLKAHTGRPHLVGTHGHLDREQSVVPFFAAGPGIPRGELPHARTVDVLPTLLTAFGRAFDAASMDGVSRLPARAP